MLLVERLLQPHGAPPESNPFEKIRSGTTTTVALWVATLQLPAASRTRTPIVSVPTGSELVGIEATVPLNFVPEPAAGTAVPTQYSPPATPLASPLTSGSEAPLTVRVTVGAP